MRPLWRHYFNNTDGLVNTCLPHLAVNFDASFTFSMILFCVHWVFNSIGLSHLISSLYVYLHFCWWFQQNPMQFILVSLCMQIYVVDSLDRERIGKAKQEFQVVNFWRDIELNTLIWVFISQLTGQFSCRPLSKILLCWTVSFWCLPINRTWYVLLIVSCLYFAHKLETYINRNGILFLGQKWISIHGSCVCLLWEVQTL